MSRENNDKCFFVSNDSLYFFSAFFYVGEKWFACLKSKVSTKNRRKKYAVIIIVLPINNDGMSLFPFYVKFVNFLSLCHNSVMVFGFGMEN